MVTVFGHLVYVHLILIVIKVKIYLYCRLTDAATALRHATLPAYVTMTSLSLTRSAPWQLSRRWRSVCSKLVLGCDLHCEP